MKTTKMQKGITLIALIITIIILLILAIVAIGSIKNSNIITYAQNSSIDYNREKDEEESTISGYEAVIESNLPETTKIETITMSEAQQDSMLTKEVNSITYDLYGNKIVIPAGFKILVGIDKTGYTVDDINVTKGIVIQDIEGNEFVWIPVGENIKNEDKTAEIKLSRYTFNSSTGKETNIEDSVIDGCQELESSTKGNATAKDLSRFLSSVNTNKGYYIARYEAGITGFDSSNITTSNSNGEISWTGYIAENGKKLKLVSKYNQQVWNYVTQNKAAELCKNMYPENANYTSDLINSYAWDTAIVFIQTFETDASNYSMLNQSKKFGYTGENNLDQYCNIYDMSGNANEWSTETTNDFNNPAVYRGGDFFSGAGNFTSYRGNFLNDFTISVHSFRPIIYIEN